MPNNKKKFCHSSSFYRKLKRQLEVDETNQAIQSEISESDLIRPTEILHQKSISTCAYDLVGNS